MRRALLALVGLALVVAGCAVSTNDDPVEVSSELLDPLLTTTSTTTTTTPSEVTKEATVYLLDARTGSTTLRPVPRPVDVDAGVQEILGNLFTVRPDVEGDDRPDELGFTTAIPETAELIAATVAPGSTNLVVDVRGLFGAGGIQGNDLRDALAQIVWTATLSDDVGSVSFLNDGDPVPAAIDDGETTDQPVSKADYSAQR